jgi:hypothetical protein
LAAKGSRENALRSVVILIAGLACIAAICGEPKHQRAEEPTPVQRDLSMSTHPDALAATSVILRADDLGAGWENIRDLAGGDEMAPEPVDVTPADVDPGIEDPDARCGVARIVGLPDGVKTAAEAAMFVKQAENGGMVTTAAATFPSEENAVARFEGYKRAITGCADETRVGIDDASMPPELRMTVKVEQIVVPEDGYGVRTIAGGLGGFFGAAQTDVIIRRGRMIAGLHVTEFAGPADVQIDALVELIASRLDAAAESLPPGPGPVPLWSVDAAAQHAADAAITTEDDYPRAWRQPIVMPLTEANSEISSTGTRLFVLSGSKECVAIKLQAQNGMLARGGNGLQRVGRDHYVWHYVAVFVDEPAAQRAAEYVIESERVCGEQNAAARSPDVDITWTVMPIEGFGPDVHVIAGIQRWRIEAHDGFPERTVLTTDMTAVLRRGRMLATVTFNVGGEDIASAEDALRAVLTRLEAASSGLDP